MKKIFLSTLSAILVVSLFSGNFLVHAAETVATENKLIELNQELIVDGGFEEKSSSWKKTGDGQLTDYAGSADTGNVCGLLPSNSGNASVYQAISLKSKTDYVAKARIALGADGQIVNFIIKNSNLSATPIPSAEAVVSCDVNDPTKAPFIYQDISFEFNTGDETTLSLAAMKWTADNASATYKGQVYIDNVSLKEKNSTNTNYEMVWADDFNQSQLDTNKWGYELGSIRGVEQQHYVKSNDNTFMRDGKLVLKATDRAVEDQYKNPRGNRKVIYNSGSIRTHGKQEFLYGRIEMKARLPKGKGVFPAFWTLGSNFTLDGDINDKQGNPWSRCGEIDIMELTGKDLGDVGNKQVWGTPHFYHPTAPETDSTGSKGKAYQINEDYNNAYHVFGVNWSPDKIEWYVDGVIYNTLDFSNPDWGKYAKMSYSQPQYIQFNLAMGGNWPGDAGTNLAGTEFDIDYVYYAQNAEQKAAAKAYYDAAPNISGLKNITMTQGEMPNLLKDITSDKDSFVDFSIDNEYMFKNEGGLTNVDRVCSGKDDAAKLAKLPAGKYNIHYTAIPNDVEYVGGVPNREKEYKMTRRTVSLTVQERIFPKDITLSGVYGEKLSTVTLPKDWSWDKPDTVMNNADTKYTVNYESNGFKTTASVKVQLVTADKTALKAKLDDAKTYLDETVYTSESLAVLKTKIDAAQAVLDKTNATKAEVATALNDLNTAVTGLNKKPVNPPVKDIYEIIQEKEQVIEQGKEITFKSNASIEKFKEVLIDGKVLDKVHYTVKEGSTIIILDAEYTKLLSSGEHKITIVSTDGQATTKFTIEKLGSTPNIKPSVKPETADKTNTALFVCLTTLAFTGIWVFFKRKENRV